MYTQLKELFKRKTPSVRLFKKLLNELPESEQVFYKKAAVNAAFCDWENCPNSYRTFLTDLFFHDKQKTLDYLIKKTVLGSLRYQLHDPELMQKLFTHVEGKQEDGYMPSYVRLSFTLLLSFLLDKSVEYYGDILRQNDFTPGDFVYLIELKDDWDNTPRNPPYRK